MPSQESIDEAKKLWQYMPYRRCWVAEKDGEHFRVVCEATARRANMLARDGWAVFELQRA